MKKTLAAACLAFTAISSTAHAEIEEAKKGSLLWSAFSCAVYAERAKDEEEQHRLFNFGLQVANEFYEALRQDKITKEEADREIPWIVLMSLGGPSDDFRSGVIYSHAIDSAFRNIGDRADEFAWKSLYRKANCEHLGR